MFTDAAFARLSPPILNYLDEVGLPHELLTAPGGVSTLLVHNPDTDTYFVDVVVLVDDGPQLIMRLDPAQRGLVVRDGVVDADDYAV
jgi:hypothetical protein